MAKIGRGAKEMGDVSDAVTISLRAEADAFTSEKDGAQTTLAEVEDRLRQGKLVELRETNLRLAAENENFRATVHKLTARLQASERRCADLEERLSDGCQQRHELESKFRELLKDFDTTVMGAGVEELLNTCGIRFHQLKRQCDQAEHNLSALHAQLFRFDTRIRSLMDELRQEKKRADRIRKERDKLREECDTLRTTMGKCKQANDQKLAKVQRRLEAAEVECKRLHDRLQHMLSSKTWRYTRPIRVVYGFCRRTLRSNTTS